MIESWNLIVIFGMDFGLNFDEMTRSSVLSWLICSLSLRDIFKTLLNSKYAVFKFYGVFKINREPNLGIVCIEMIIYAVS